MSSIPNAKMKHAHVHHDEDGHEEHRVVSQQPATNDAGSVPQQSGDGKKAKVAKHESLTERAMDLAEEAVDAVKARPKTVAAIGAAVLAGAAALVGGPAIAKAVKGDVPKKKPAAKKKAPAKK